MKPRWKILLVLGGFLALAAASAFLSVHVKPADELEAYRKQLRDQGEKLTLAEVVPPMAAPEENGADIVRDAAATFGAAPANYSSAMMMVGPGRAAVGWVQVEVRGHDLHGYEFTNSWDEYRAHVESYRPAVESLHKILVRPKIDFQLDYTQGEKLAIPHLGFLKRAAQELAVSAMVGLHDGDSGAATTNILTMLALVQKDYRNGLLIAYQVRIARAIATVPITWELLQATNIDDPQLASVQNAWQQINFVNDAENTFVMERAWLSEQFEKYRSSHEHFAELGGYSGGASSFSPVRSGGWDWSSLKERSRFAVAEVMWRSSWSFSQELKMLKCKQAMLAGARAMRTSQQQFYKADYDVVATNVLKLAGTGGGSAIFRTLKIPDYDECFVIYESGLYNALPIETARHVVITAIALKRFQLKHGRWPASLAELTPEFLPSVPVDPYDGKPLKYHPNDDGTYLLYSVGEDGIDDGGDASPIVAGSFGTLDWQKARDWVWPQPATPAEIQYFREHPPK